MILNKLSMSCVYRYPIYKAVGRESLAMGPEAGAGVSVSTESLIPPGSPSGERHHREQRAIDAGLEHELSAESADCI